MKTPTNRRRKKLDRPEQEFYLLVAFAYGRPDDNVRDYVGPNGFAGTSMYLAYHPKGQIFTHCVTSCGEAKCRAAQWLFRYTRWWREQQPEFWDRHANAAIDRVCEKLALIYGDPSKVDVHGSNEYWHFVAKLNSCLRTESPATWLGHYRRWYAKNDSRSSKPAAGLSPGSGDSTG